MAFKAGQALLNKSAWEKDIKLLQQNGIEPKAFLKRSVERGTVGYFDPHYFAKNKSPVFNKQQYSSLQELVEKYQKMDESAINYKGLEQHRFIFEQKLEEYLKLGIMREATERERREENIWINPLNCIKTGEGKYSVLLHWLGNGAYSKPRMHLTDISEEGLVLKEQTSLRCEDLKSCYHQYPLSDRSMYASGCVYRGVVYICQTMMYGPAPCVIIADELLEIAATATAIRHNCVVFSYIDQGGSFASLQFALLRPQI